MSKRTGNNRHNITWGYAQSCWQSLKNGEPIPPIPEYDIWETDENGTKGRVLIGKKLIEPCKVTCNGVTVFG